MLEEIPNFRVLSDTLLTGGMPTAGQLQSAAQSGVQVVINLAPFDPARDLANEGPLVESLGMRYIHIPVDWEAPTAQNLETFFSVMDSLNTQKKLVHCRANYRVSGFVALYRIRRLGWKPEEAFKNLLSIWNPDEYPIWKEFMEKNLESGGK